MYEHGVMFCLLNFPFWGKTAVNVYISSRLDIKWQRKCSLVSKGLNYEIRWLWGYFRAWWKSTPAYAEDNIISAHGVFLTYWMLCHLLCCIRANQFLEQQCSCNGNCRLRGFLRSFSLITRTSPINISKDSDI